MKKRNVWFLSALAAVVLPQAALADQAPAKNVILMISDGAGMQTWNAASYYRHGALGKEVYDGFPVKLFASTHPLNTSKTPTKTRDGAITFDAAQLWRDGVSEGAGFEGKLRQYEGFFQGYDYARRDFTDSAAAATALASGQKTYNNVINWSNDDAQIKHIGEYVVESGRALGVVTSVQWTHATPAGFLAHNGSRNNYAEIGREIVDSGLADVVMGAGHPGFDDNGKPVEPKDEKAYQFVGGKATWKKLASGQSPYCLIESREDFAALAGNTLDFQGKQKVLGTAQTAQTLQFNRDGQAAGAWLANQPDLTEMTQGALNVVSRNPQGLLFDGRRRGGGLGGARQQPAAHY